MNNYNDYNRYTSYSEFSGSQISLADYSRRVYAWMASGLALTFLIGFFLMRSFDGFTDEQIMSYAGIYLVVSLTELILVVVLGFFVYKLPPAVSTVLFYAYSVCNGVTVAPVLYVYGMETVFYAFAATALMFTAISVYGFLTKRDLTKIGPILIIGLIILIIHSIIAIFINIPMSDLIMSILGIALFTGFTAFDTQKIKKGYYYFGQNTDMVQRSSITIALQLYLDFINLFLYILRFFARDE